MDSTAPLTLPQMAVQMQIQTAVAHKVADVQKTQAAQVLQLLDAVAEIGAQAQEPDAGTQLNEHA
jgi:hypothetical protein